jgi:DNA repair protein SbcD/Mre11
MRFLHIADVHLDAPFGGRSPTVRRALQEAARGALSRAVSLAVEERVHAFLVAGDLFDGHRLSFATERFLTTTLQRLGDAGIPVVYASGNHDHGGRERSPAWPPNVAVVDGPEPVRVAILDGDGATVGFVTAAGHGSPRVTEDLAATFPRPPGEYPEIALLHAQVRGSRGEEGHHPYALTTPDVLRDAGYDYWALGHVHGWEVLGEAPLICYSGSLTGRTLRETGARGGLLVDLSDRENPRMEFRPLAPIRWEIVHVDDLGDVATVDRFLDRLGEAWSRARVGDPGEPDTRWLIQFRASGGCPLWRKLRDPEEVATLEREAAGVLQALDVSLRMDRVGPPVDPAREAERSDVLGEALLLLARVHEGEPILDLAEEELAGYDPEEHGSVHAYIRRLLGDADRELIARLLDGRSEESQ